jgi:hypothetical protein
LDITALKPFIPLESHTLVSELLSKYPCYLKIVHNRKTKHGDFRVVGRNKYQITINKDMNKYRFLITLIHEIAHLKTYKEHTFKIKPHGIEWKRTYQKLLLPFLDSAIFPSSILKPLANYAINPKASTDTDHGLSLSLKQFDTPNNKQLLFELSTNCIFKYNNRIFEKGRKRRVKYLCTELKTKKEYVFHPNAEVERIS